MNYERNLKLRNEMSKWLNKIDWEIWFTGTFQPERSYRDTIKTKKAFNRFIELMSKKYDKHGIEYFMAVERFKSGGFTHCHSLLKGLDGVSYQQIGEAWRHFYGRESVEQYDPKKGANFYLTKYITNELCDWDFVLSKNKSHILTF